AERVGVERIGKEIRVCLQGEGRRKRPHDVFRKGSIDDESDRRIQEQIEENKKNAHHSLAHSLIEYGRNLHFECIPVKPVRRRSMVQYILDMKRNDRKNRTTLIADPSAQVPVSPNCCARLMPKDGELGPPRKRGVTAEARQGMNTSAIPMAVPIQLSGQVTSTKARQGPAPLILAVSRSAKSK